MEALFSQFLHTTSQGCNQDFICKKAVPGGTKRKQSLVIGDTGAHKKGNNQKQNDVLVRTRKGIINNVYTIPRSPSLQTL